MSTFLMVGSRSSLSCHARVAPTGAPRRAQQSEHGGGALVATGPAQLWTVLG